MRILSLRFKNLNSLVGEWSIDFQHHSYRDEGIFAITGPTGAGKSTILDALTLALYGRTPRLARISQSENEIMSRRTAECFAEVTFEVKSKRFRCHWSQRRAHKKADGALQVARQEIADAETGTVLYTKTRDVAACVVEETGMDFDRFTRSILLAQGAFTAFLQSSPDERSPLLEQITGTEVYSQISMQVHEQTKQKKERADELSAQCAAVNFLHEEERQLLQDELQLLGEAEKKLQQEAEDHRLKLAYYSRLDVLQTEKKELEVARAHAESTVVGFGPSRKRLELANKSMLLAGPYAELAALRKEQRAEAARLQSLSQSLPLLITTRTTAQNDKEAHERALQALRQKNVDLAPVLKTVREMDTRLAEKKLLVIKAEKDRDEKKLVLQRLKADVEQSQKAYEDVQVKVVALQRELEKTAGDDLLVEQFTTILSRFEVLEQHQRQAAQAAERLHKAEAQVVMAKAALTTAQSKKEREQVALDQLKKKIAATVKQQEQVLSGVTAEALREKKERLYERMAVGRGLVQKMQELSGAVSHFIVLEKEKTTVKERLFALQTEFEGLEKKRQEQEKQTALLETQMLLAQKVQSLEKARKELAADTPCPLCGSLHHPYVDDSSLPTVDSSRQLFEAEKKQLQDIVTSSNRTSVELAKLTNEQKRYDERQAEGRSLCQKISDAVFTSLHEFQSFGYDGLDDFSKEVLVALLAEGAIIDALPQFSTDTFFTVEVASQMAASAEGITVFLEAVDKERVRCSGALEAHKKEEEALRALKKEAENQNEQLVLADRELVKAEGQGAFAEETLAKEVDRKKEEDVSLEALLLELQGLVRPFGFEPPDVPAMRTAVGGIAERKAARMQLLQENSRLLPMAEKLDFAMKNSRVIADTMESSVKTQEEEAVRLTKEYEELLAQRYQLFEKKDADVEEAGLAQQLQTAQKAYEVSLARCDAASAQVREAESSLGVLEKKLDERAGHVHTLEETFLVLLGNSGLGTEENFLQARMEEEERAGLQATLEQAQKKLDEITRSFADKEREVQKILLTCKGIPPHDELAEMLRKVESSLKETLQQVGGIQQRLNEDTSARNRHQESIRRLEALQQEYLRWNCLNELIGSYDGKKYRNFAQGLTFEVVVAHANRQLMKMTDRYVLARDESSPLELNVIDGYQAGEVRSARNLSGGESFIVSLALALGLSQMASKNIRVDSLFLDEGFGTLDEDALEVALETLSSLPQDGKLIGVISHVGQLKERIGTQISVVPQSGGQSILRGPGCSGNVSE